MEFPPTFLHSAARFIVTSASQSMNLHTTQPALRLFVFGLVVTVAFLVGNMPLAALHAEETNDQPGLVKEKPADGRFVETEQGFMVPYELAIPGTDVSFTMQPIPGGSFKLGSPESEADRSEDEGPQVEIEIAPFWMAQHETTWAEYKTFMNIYNPLKSVQAMRSLWQSDNKSPKVVEARDALVKAASKTNHLKHLLAANVEGVRR